MQAYKFLAFFSSTEFLQLSTGTMRKEGRKADRCNCETCRWNRPTCLSSWFHCNMSSQVPQNQDRGMYGNYRQVSGKIGSVVFKRWSTSKSHLPDFLFLFNCFLPSPCWLCVLTYFFLVKWNQVIMLQFSSNHLLFGIFFSPKNSSMFLESSCLDFFFLFLQTSFQLVYFHHSMLIFKNNVFIKDIL